MTGGTEAWKERERVCVRERGRERRKREREEFQCMTFLGVPGFVGSASVRNFCVSVSLRRQPGPKFFGRVVTQVSNLWGFDFT